MSDTQSPGDTRRILRDHHLDYITELQVSDVLLTARFASSCNASLCSARCCRAGVLVDIAHRDRIIAEAPLIVQYMEATQEHDPAKWFDAEEEPDLDFPSGRAVNTNSTDDACVFLDSRRLCVLQSAEAESPGLKPFYCRAYPVAIVHGCVTLDAEWCPDETQCCGPVDGGP